MNSLHMIQNFIKAENLQKASLTSFKPGQLLYGRVEKFLANDSAIVQIGGMKILAQVKASLSIAENYLFEVQANGDGGIQLKVLDGNEGQPANLLEQLHLPDTKINTQLVKTLMDHNIPMTKEQIKTVTEWIIHQPDVKEITALEWMVKKDLPFTKQVFQSLVAVQEPQPFSHQLETLAARLEDPNLSNFSTIQPLKQKIAEILANPTIDQVQTGSEVKQMLKTMIRHLGLEYENAVGEWAGDKSNASKTLHSLKPLLLNALNELGSNGKEIEPVINRLTGMQLISQDPTTAMQQMVLQLPITFGNKNTDITLQWTGKKNKNGQMDPDYCRVLFYLDLEHMDQTILDMQVQNRVIHVSIINDKKDIEPVVSALTPNVKQKLEALGYKLSYIKVNPAYEKTDLDPQELNSVLLPKEIYQGVDIKI
ncbi:hypothetical protein HPT25_22395 [Bacillus sp. BRMEA1]|uniref:hypothetical protein n=1 Tax=Neobacillus endophyticus TaxID=2738405 RepID=UPI00156306ED|nr:hypothetical protein [Neobacillus endophyticus]NRD80092.1 hypothetical protein [Neobacillus endophyticus]